MQTLRTLLTLRRASVARRLRAALDTAGPTLLLMLLLPALVGIARCATPFDHAKDDIGTVATYPERDAKRWTIDEQGLGPLRAGLAVPEVGKVLPGAITIPAGEEANACGYADWPDAPGGVFVLIEHGTISRIEVDSANIATSAGIRVGDAEQRVEEAYAGRVERRAHPYLDGAYLVVRAGAAGDHGIVFETDGRRVTRYRAGGWPAVLDAEGCEAPLTSVADEGSWE